MSVQGLGRAGDAGRVQGADPEASNPTATTARQRRRSRRAGDQTELVTDSNVQPANPDQNQATAPRRRTIMGRVAAAVAVGVAGAAFITAKNYVGTSTAPAPLTPGDLSQLPTVIVPNDRRDPDCYPHCLTEGDNQGVAHALGKSLAYFQKYFSDDGFSKAKSVAIEFSSQARPLLPEYLREEIAKGGARTNVIGAVVYHEMVEHRPGAKPQLVPPDILARCPDAADICMQGQFINQLLRKEVKINLGWVSQSYNLDIDGKIDLDNAFIMAMQLRPGGKRPPYFLEIKGISPSHKKWAVTANGTPASLLQFARHLEARFDGANNLRKAIKGSGNEADQLYFRVIGNDGLLQILEDSVRGRPQVLTPEQSRS